MVALVNGAILPVALVAVAEEFAKDIELVIDLSNFSNNFFKI